MICLFCQLLLSLQQIILNVINDNNTNTKVLVSLGLLLFALQESLHVASVGDKRPLLRRKKEYKEALGHTHTHTCAHAPTHTHTHTHTPRHKRESVGSGWENGWGWVGETERGRERERVGDKTRQQFISLGLRPLERGEHCTLSFPALIYHAWSKQTI